MQQKTVCARSSMPLGADYTKSKIKNFIGQLHAHNAVLDWSQRHPKSTTLSKRMLIWSAEESNYDQQKMKTEKIQRRCV